jgi:GH43 family beta-xylosidase
MKKNSINLRDPFVVFENGKYYLYGSRAKNFAIGVGGFDVYVSDDLIEWSEPVECFDSIRYNMNKGSNWAPEVHKYNGKYYMFATFTQENGLIGTYSLVSDSLLGPFIPLSNGALTPKDWACLDGTLFIDDDGTPYLIFCHEHMQILDGTICFVKLNNELSAPIGDVVTLFAASSNKKVDPLNVTHFVTDGPFMYRSKTGELFMIWSSFIKEKYAELVVKFKNKKFGTEFEHLEPLIDSDGGHGMIFSDGMHTYFTYHTPNISLSEHPEFCVLNDNGDSLSINAH